MIGVGVRGPLAQVDERSASSGGTGGWFGLDLARLDTAAERPYWISLSLVPGMGPVGFGRLLHRFGSARAAWAAGAPLLESLPRLPDDAAPMLSRLRRAGASVIAGRVTGAAQRAGGVVVTALDAGYPPSLAAVDPRPPLLYLAGDPAALTRPCVAVVGTRRATGYGRACTIEIADELARAGVTVISGLALGIDGEAHRAAVAAGGRSVAVLPSPLDRVYPPRHRELAARLVATGGALVSELPPAQAVGRPDFARRNRIIAGLARAVVVVEAPDRSGALLTVAAAIGYGREVFAVPGPIDAVASRGCNRLIADHQATIVTSAAALLHRIGAEPGGRPVSVASLSEAEALVLHALLQRPGSIEELIARTRIATGSLASTLTLLEARGLVEAYGGATFHPTLAARRIGRRPEGAR
ncbi:MAG TPA: DNA-processing protein DprA [Candidatus Limnocylindria bacterium]|nr:DNA-processing protein DprA [Candidatus Limnocylindria bacterium]